VVEYAIEEARVLSIDYVDVPQLLLGCWRVEGGLAAAIFAEMGLMIEDLRSFVRESV
jgi:hypothetical protein